MFKLEISTTNDAYCGDDARRAEVARNLGEVASNILAGLDAGIVKDINGNTVGSWKLEDEQ